MSYPITTTGGSQDPWLSILIPTYNQPFGVKRIFDSLQSLRGRNDVELIVSDDSTEDSKADQIGTQCAEFGQVRYQRNQPPQGAVPNWNKLLDQARGRYLILLHHDEAFAPDTDLPALMQALQAPNAPEASLLACYVVHRPGSPPRLHFPAGLAAAIARRHPSYLLRRNLFGPASALIIRSDCYCRFDERLRWRVDMEAYYRTLRRLRSLYVWPCGGVISHRDATNSITAKLSQQIQKINAVEHNLLAQKYAAIPGMRWLFDLSLIPRVTRALERTLWSGFRLMYRIYQLATYRR